MILNEISCRILYVCTEFHDLMILCLTLVGWWAWEGQVCIHTEPGVMWYTQVTRFGHW